MAEKKPVQQAVPTEAETDAHVDDLVNKALKALFFEITNRYPLGLFLLSILSMFSRKEMYVSCITSSARS